MDKIEAAAEAMKAKRDELIAQPLARIWLDLAKAAIAAIEAAETEARRKACQHLRATGNGWTNGLGDGHFEWRCPDCGASSGPDLSSRIWLGPTIVGNTP